MFVYKVDYLMFSGNLVKLLQKGYVSFWVDGL